MTSNPRFNLLKLVCIALLFGIQTQVNAQQNSIDSATTDSLVRIVKTDGTTLVGYIITENPSEIILDVKGGERVRLVQYKIARVEKVVEKAAHGDSHGEISHPFSTRYVFSSNGIPLKKGNHHIRANLTGPTLQFSLGHNFELSLHTTWIASPILLGLKKNFILSENIHLSTGLLAGHFTYLYPDLLITAPFVGITVGDAKKNITVTSAYANIWTSDKADRYGRLMTSVGGMIDITKKVTFVFDSFIIHRAAGIGQPNDFLVPGSELPSTVLLMPNMRWNYKPNKAFQFGLLGIFDSKDGFAFALPMFQYMVAF